MPRGLNAYSFPLLLGLNPWVVHPPCFQIANILDSHAATLSKKSEREVFFMNTQSIVQLVQKWVWLSLNEHDSLITQAYPVWPIARTSFLSIAGLEYFWWSSTMLCWFLCQRRLFLFPTGIAVASVATWRRWWWTCLGSTLKSRSSFKMVMIINLIIRFEVHCSDRLPHAREMCHFFF